ncbi:MAG: transposase [Pirellulales bacterium]
MPRRPRFATGGYVYHVLNRAVARRTIFEADGDYLAFERTLEEARRQVPMRLLAYTIMPNHWHLLIWPVGDDDLSEYMRWLSVTHTQRWHAFHETAGTGSLYQGRFKSFPVEEDEHFFTVCRYVERNALRAGLVSRAGMWRWSSLWQRNNLRGSVSLDAWPVPMPSNWIEYVNGVETEAELAAVRNALCRGSPFGGPSWRHTTATRLGLERTLRQIGRPRSF